MRELPETTVPEFSTVMEARNPEAATSFERQACGPGTMSGKLSLTWIDHPKCLVGVFGKLLEHSSLVDCTLAAEGQYLRAHKLVLSACSPYFELLFNQENEKNPIVILKDIKFKVLKAIIDFMYLGIVNIIDDELEDLTAAAKSLHIKGFGEVSMRIGPERKSSENLVFSASEIERNRHSPAPHKRRKISSEEYCVGSVQGTTGGGEDLPQIQIEQLTSLSTSQTLKCSSFNSNNLLSSPKTSKSSEINTSSFMSLLPKDPKEADTVSQNRNRKNISKSSWSLLSSSDFNAAFKIPVELTLEHINNCTETRFCGSPSVFNVCSAAEEENSDRGAVDGEMLEPLTAVYVPESEELLVPKEEICVEEMSLQSDGGDEMEDCAEEDILNQQSLCETEVKENGSCMIPQVEAETKSQGGDETVIIPTWKEVEQIEYTSGIVDLTALEENIEDNHLISNGQGDSSGDLYIFNSKTNTLSKAVPFPDNVSSNAPSASWVYQEGNERLLEFRRNQEKGNHELNNGNEELMAEKLPWEVDLCNGKCRFHCNDILSVGERKMLFERFYSFDQSAKNEYLLSVMEPIEVKTANILAKRKRCLSYKYSVPVGYERRQLCKTAVLNLLGLNRTTLELVRDYQKVNNTFINSRNSEQASMAKIDCLTKVFSESKSRK